MAFHSLRFLVFFPAVICIYFLVPEKLRYIWLLVSSYYFYMCWNAEYVLLLLFSTAVTYLGGILLSRNRYNWSRKIILALSLLLNLGLLFFFKYFDFVFQNVNALCMRAGIVLDRPVSDIVLPVGISFYTFQAAGYIIDVYRGDIQAERNILKYALFVSFFPQLVAGPIERSKNLLAQIRMPAKFDVNRARYGLLAMAYGYILKIVIADRIASVIDPVLADYQNYHGMAVLVCILLFAFQIYCDFHGYTQIAVGSAKILGFDLLENFNAPYLAGNVKEFWRRWHISLTSWFTEYVYIPLGGNRKGKVRTRLHTLAVFLCSGLWHGASWAFAAWGG